MCALLTETTTKRILTLLVILCDTTAFPEALGPEMCNRAREDAVVTAKGHHHKEELASLKVDAELVDVRRRIPNKSRFIRKTVLQAPRPRVPGLPRHPDTVAGGHGVLEGVHEARLCGPLRLIWRHVRSL